MSKTRDQKLGTVKLKKVVISQFHTLLHFELRGNTCLDRQGNKL